MAITLARAKMDGDENWISIADLMAGLMMVFLFILVIYAKTIDEYAKTAQEHAKTVDEYAKIAEERLSSTQDIVAEWRDTELAIYKALKDEFESDLDRWNAEIEPGTLTIRFLSPDILFETGKADLKPRYKDILDDFMPRYIALLADEFDADIDEVRIEGHTSYEWNEGTDENEAFINNMALSQSRTRTVLEYSLDIPNIQHLTSWMIRKVSANGLSSARLIKNKSGEEDKRLSKRVEFKIKTKTQETLFKIIDEIAPAIEKGFK